MMYSLVCMLVLSAAFAQLLPSPTGQWKKKSTDDNKAFWVSEIGARAAPHTPSNHANKMVVSVEELPSQSHTIALQTVLPECDGSSRYFFTAFGAIGAGSEVWIHCHGPEVWDTMDYQFGTWAGPTVSSTDANRPGQIDSDNTATTLLVATLDASTGRYAVYQDGNLVGSNDAVTIRSSDKTIRIDPFSNFPGDVHNVRYWNECLTKDQVSFILPLARDETPVVAPEPVGHWKNVIGNDGRSYWITVTGNTASPDRAQDKRNYMKVTTPVNPTEPHSIAIQTTLPFCNDVRQFVYAFGKPGSGSELFIHCHGPEAWDTYDWMAGVWNGRNVGYPGNPGNGELITSDEATIITMTYAKDGAYSVYQDGALVATHAYIEIYNTDKVLRMDPYKKFAGDLMNIRFYDSALSSDEVATIKFYGRTKPRD